jgi:hypothetical protein
METLLIYLRGERGGVTRCSPPIWEILDGRGGVEGKGANEWTFSIEVCSVGLLLGCMHRF